MKAAATRQAAVATPLCFDNLASTISTPHNNSMSVKLLHYLDYLARRPRHG